MKRKDTRKRILKEGEYQRSNGTYEYKWRDKKGNRHSIYAKTLEELREKEIDVLRDMIQGVPIIDRNITINDLYYRWIKLKRGLKDNTFKNYQYMYEQFVLHDFGKSKISDLKRTDVRAFYNNLYDEKHIKVSTIESLHTVLHQVLEIAVEDEIIKYNPSDSALKELKRAHNVDMVKRRSLTLDEQALFEKYLIESEDRWYPVFCVMMWTGLRASEICGLTWDDINLDEGYISVNHSLVYYPKGKGQGCGYAINSPKSEKGRRIVPMIGKVKDAFMMEKEYQDENGIKCKIVIDNYTDFIFVNRFGSPQNYSALNKALKRIIRDCNYKILESSNDENIILLPPFSNHNLRHTFTTRMCESGVNIKAMQEILGHADAEITMNIYADATKEFKFKQMISFEEFFNKHNYE